MCESVLDGLLEGVIKEPYSSMTEPLSENWSTISFSEETIEQVKEIIYREMRINAIVKTYGGKDGYVPSTVKEEKELRELVYENIETAGRLIFELGIEEFKLLKDGVIVDNMENLLKMIKETKGQRGSKQWIGKGSLDAA